MTEKCDSFSSSVSFSSGLVNSPVTPVPPVRVLVVLATSIARVPVPKTVIRWFACKLRQMIPNGRDVLSCQVNCDEARAQWGKASGNICGQCLVKFWNFIYSSAGLFHCAWACKSLPAFGKSTNRGKRAKVFREGALQELKVLTRSLNLSGDCTSKARVTKQLAIKVVN